MSLSTNHLTNSWVPISLGSFQAAVQQLLEPPWSIQVGKTHMNTLFNFRLIPAHWLDSLVTIVIYANTFNPNPEVTLPTSLCDKFFPRERSLPFPLTEHCFLIPLASANDSARSEYPSKTDWSHYDSYGNESAESTFFTLGRPRIRSGIRCLDP